jgi:hypothetical protein
MLPASVITTMIALGIAILVRLLPKILFIIKPEEGAFYTENDPIPLQVDAFNYVARLRLALVDPWVKWSDDLSGATVIGRQNSITASKLGTHTITVTAPGFISSQVTIEVVPVIVYSPLVPA